MMKLNNVIRLRVITAMLFTSSLLFSGLASAAGDAAAGEAAYAEKNCDTCHGEAGNSTDEANPKLAGQYESYLVQALKSYRSGARQNSTMAGFAAALTDQEIADLAAYFSSQKSSLQTVEPK